MAMRQRAHGQQSFADLALADLGGPDARMRGWTRLGQAFAAPGSTAALTTERQDATVGTAGLFKTKHVIRAAATDEGLYLAMPALLRAGHPPLLIPWSRLRLDKEHPPLLREAPVLDLRVMGSDDANAASVGRTILRGGVAAAVKQRLSP